MTAHLTPLGKFAMAKECWEWVFGRLWAVDTKLAELRYPQREISQDEN